MLNERQISEDGICLAIQLLNNRQITEQQKEKPQGKRFLLLFCKKIH